ncbi:hypothetical protein D3L32_20565 [Salmonella enterica]|nr:hypothetical protein [Salmonella enterica]
MREINNQIIDPVRIADAFCRQHPQVTTNIEQARLMKGKAFPDWPYWCFLPITRWLMLFMGGQKREFTPAVWLEIQKLSVLGTWRYSKGIYTPHLSLLNALAETPVSDTLPVDVFLRFPEWCIYISTPGMRMQGEELYGFWAMVNQNDVNNDKSLYLLLNRMNELKLESFRLKTGSVNTILEDMFHEGLDASGATPETIETLKHSGYLSAHLKSKASDAGRLLSILLYICSDEPEIDSERQPGSYPARPKPVKTKKGFRLFPANGPRYWRVGENMGEMLATAFAETDVCAASGRQVRAHLRRGHWHGFWSGKRDDPEEQKFSYHWLPPQIIGGRRNKVVY